MWLTTTLLYPALPFFGEGIVPCLRDQILSYSVTVLLIDSGPAGSSLMWSGLSLHEKIPEPPNTNGESAPAGFAEESAKPRG